MPHELGSVTAGRSCRTLGLVSTVASVVFLAGCGDGERRPTTAEIERALTRQVQERVDESNGPVAIGNTRCVEEQDGTRWRCLYEADVEGEDPVTVGGIYTCDDTTCIWKQDG